MISKSGVWGHIKDRFGYLDENDAIKFCVIVGTKSKFYDKLLKCIESKRESELAEIVEKILNDFKPTRN